jgi:prepilin-type N-terminal cleavage/methylation domain-containing protein
MCSRKDASSGSFARSRIDRGEGGFTLLELVVALSLLATVTMGFALTMGAGFRTIAVARQRQTASDILTEKIEHLRGVPFDQVALSSAPTHASDPTNPDYYVSADGSEYDVTGAGQNEGLVTPITDGVLHFEDPVQVSSTIMKIYQYVTWVDEPNVKRVTVVAVFHAPAANGVNQMVRSSSLFTPDTVTVSASTTTTTTVPSTTTTSSPTTTTSSPSTTTTTSGACPGDHSAPTGSYTLAATTVSETGYTASPNVAITLALSDSCTPISVQFSNDSGATYGSAITYDSLNPTVSWALAAGDGNKTVTVQISDAAGNSRVLSSQSLILDTTKPTVPGTLTRTVTCSGTDRNVTLSWSMSTDTYLHGYRVYRSTDGVSWSALTTVLGTSYTDTHKKTLDSVRYYVVAYDRAGNESNATNVISLSKKQCS